MNTPNKITLARLILIPFIVFFYLATFIPYGRLVSALLFIIACLTDFVDGYLARKNNQVTDLGKFFDSIADKVLVMTGMILIVAVPLFDRTSSASEIWPMPVVYPSWLGVTCVVIMLAREFIISALRQISAAKGIILAADKGGKIKATAQFVIISMYMIFAFILTDIVHLREGDKVVGIIRFILMLLLVATTLLTIYTGVSYLIRNKNVFKSEEEKPKNFIDLNASSEDEIESVVIKNDDKENPADEIDEKDTN